MRTSFSENLKYAMSCKGMITKELATATGIKFDTIANYLKSNSSEPTVTKAVKIAQALDVSVEFLVTGKDKTHSNSIKPEAAKLLELINTLSDADTELISTIIQRLSKTDGGG